MRVTIKDLIVVGLALLGGLSDINWLDVPFWAYLILLVVYVALRFMKRDFGVQLFRGGGISRPTETNATVPPRGGGISRPTE